MELFIVEVYIRVCFINKGSVNKNLSFIKVKILKCVCICVFVIVCDSCFSVFVCFVG